MELQVRESEQLRRFLDENKSDYEKQLLSQAVNVRDKIDEIHQIGNIDLLKNAHKLALLIIDGKQDELMEFARQEGEAWAKHALTVSFKLEWIQAIRRVLWDFLFNFDKINNIDADREDFYKLEKFINDAMDQFFTSFFLSYTKYKDELLKAQQDLIEDLSVPVIPLNKNMSILPLIGAIDDHRIEKIQEKVFFQISLLKIKRLVIDLSGVAYMSEVVVHWLLKMLDGINMMGCKVVITGIRPEIVKLMISYDVKFGDKAEMLGTLQQALEEYIQ